jgi:hypothetical protein
MTTKTISGAYPEGYALSPSYQALDIGSSASVGGPGVSASATQPSTINNYGTVVGSLFGVTLPDGGVLTNAGAIGGGVSVSGALGTVTNNGTIGGHYSSSSNSDYPNLPNSYTRGPAISLSNGGLVTNGSAMNVGANIDGGVTISGGVGIVISNGVIAGAAFRDVGGAFYGFSMVTGIDDAVSLSAGGTVTNARDVGGVSISGDSGTVINYGDVGSPYKYGYYYRVTTIIDRYSTTGYSISLNDGGNVTNGQAGGAVATIDSGVSISGAGTVTNFGLIGGPSSSFEYLAHKKEHYYESFGVSIFLRGGGMVTNKGTLSNGVSIAGEGTLINWGAIEGGASSGVAVSLTGGSLMVEEASGVLVGKVEGGGTLELGAAAGAGTIGGLGGTITGFATIVVAAGAGWHFTGANSIVAGQTLTTASGISEAGTLTNDGVIAAGAIIELESASELDNAVGGKLKLNNDAGVSPASGATGTSLANAGTLEAKSAGTSTIRVNIANTGVIEVVSGTLRVTGSVTGAGSVRIADATADFTTAFAEHVTFTAHSTGLLQLSRSRSYTGTVSGLPSSGTDALDLEDIDFTSGKTTASYSGTASVGVLTVTDGTHTAKIKLRGDYLGSIFTLSSDGHGGTLVRDPAPASTRALVAAIASFAPVAAGVSISSPANHIAMPLLATPGRPY